MNVVTPVRTERHSFALLAIGVVVVGANLRIAVAGVPPLLSRLGLGHTGMSLIAATPVVCFGVIAPFAPALRRAVGEERVLAAAAVGLAAGLLLRAGWFQGGLFPGTVVLSCSIALVNVLLPSLIARRAPARAGVLSGGYATAMNVGAVLGAGLSVPVSEAFGGSVRAGLGIWALPAVVAVFVWLPQARIGPSVAAGPGALRMPLRRSPLAWQVTAFMGLQALDFYALLSWLPTIYASRGVSPTGAGLLLALDNLLVIPTAFLVPAFATRRAGQQALTLTSVVLCVVGVAGILAAPTATAPLWVAILGLGQGGTFGLALLFMILRAGSPDASAGLSAMAQSIGYLVAALGPLGCGLLHALSGGWTLPLAFLLTLVVVEGAVGFGAARPLTVGGAANA